MKKNSIRKLTIAGVLVAVAVVGSLFSIPVRCCAVWPTRPARSYRLLTLVRYSAPAFSAVWLLTRLPHS